MDFSNLRYKMPLSETIRGPHLSPLYFSEKEGHKKRQYHGYSTSPSFENEYQSISKENNVKKDKSIINLTSEELKKEYSEKTEYLKSGLRHISLISFLLILDTFLELKYLGPSETNVAILIMCCVNASLCFMILFNIKGKALIDSYGYISFYCLSIVEPILFISLFICKLINFFVVFNRLNTKDSCKNKYKCPGYFIYLLILICNIIIFLGFLLCCKFSITMFCDGFNVLFLKKKTLFQKQIEMDLKDKKVQDRKIEFTDDKDESINNSLSQLNSKTE